MTDRTGANSERPFPKGIGQPAIRALNGAGYTNIDDLEGASLTALTKLHGMGPKALGIIREELERRGKGLKP